MTVDINRRSTVLVPGNYSEPSISSGFSSQASWGISSLASQFHLSASSTGWRCVPSIVLPFTNDNVDGLTFFVGGLVGMMVRYYGMVEKSEHQPEPPPLIISWIHVPPFRMNDALRPSSRRGLRPSLVDGRKWFRDYVGCWLILGFLLCGSPWRVCGWRR